MTMWDWLRRRLEPDADRRTAAARQAADTAECERRRAGQAAAAWSRDERQIRRRAANIADLLLEARDGAEAGAER